MLVLNLEMFNMAKDIAGLLGRTPATANDTGNWSACRSGLKENRAAMTAQADSGAGTTGVDPHGRHRCTALHMG